MDRRWRACLAAGIAALLIWTVPAYSAVIWPVEVPNVFAPNRPARASEVNANFDALEEAVNDVHARLAVIESRTGELVPAGTIAFFATAGCPTGWTAYGAANGRYVVAAPSGGTVGGTVGATPMTNLENRTHTHGIAHRHQWARYNDGSHTWYSFTSDAVGSAQAAVYDYGCSAGVSGGGSRRPFTLEATRSMYTGDALQTTSGTADTGAIAPYIQLRACQKS